VGGRIIKLNILYLDRPVTLSTKAPQAPFELQSSTP